MDSTIHGVTKSRTQLSDFHFHLCSLLAGGTRLPLPDPTQTSSGPESELGQGRLQPKD